MKRGSSFVSANLTNSLKLIKPNGQRSPLTALREPLTFHYTVGSSGQMY